MTWPRPQSCEHARFLAALAPDEVLDGPGRAAAVTGIFARCEPCSAFAGSVADFTVELREGPAIEPTLSVPLLLDGVRRRHRLSMRTSLVAPRVDRNRRSRRVRPHAANPGAHRPRRPGPPVLIHAAPEDETAALREFRDLCTRPSREPGAATRPAWDVRRSRDRSAGWSDRAQNPSSGVDPEGVTESP